MMKLFKTSILLYVCLLVPTLLYGKVTPNEISSESKKCIECHTKTSPSLVQMWGKSKHYRAKVSCFECHKAHPNDKDMFIHYGQRIATIVSPELFWAFPLVNHWKIHELGLDKLSFRRNFALSCF